jgi:hypothetical protein
VNIGKLGLIDVNFKPHPNLVSLSGNNKINAVQVDVAYKEETSEDYFADTLVFTAEELEGKNLTKVIGKIIDAPLDYKVTYFTKGGQSIGMQEQKYYLTENNQVNIFTPNPFEDTLDLNVELPFIPDESVKKIIVEFRHRNDEKEFESADSVLLSAEDDWESVLAKLVLIDSRNSSFQYRYRILSDEDVAKSGWIDGAGDSETILLPMLKVLLNTSQLRIGSEFGSGLLSLHYEHGETRETREIFLTPENSAGTISWYIPRTDNTDPEYLWNLTLIDTDGNSIDTGGTNKGRIFLIPKPVVM